VFDLEDILRAVFNRMRDCVTVGRAKNQGLKDQQVKSSLQHLTLKGRFVPWHALQYTPLDDLPESSVAQGVYDTEVTIREFSFFVACSRA
jgi:hypothetical protein